MENKERRKTGREKKQGRRDERVGGRKKRDTR
jgi:hypothetical protein